MKTAIVVNINSGALLNRDADDIRAEIERGMTALAGPCEVHLVDGLALNKVLRNLPRDTELLIICGGDGTLLAGAQEAMARDIPLGLIPKGTMNLLAHDLGLPISLEEGLASVGKGRRRRIDVGYVNDRPFLNAVVIGTFARLAQTREQIRNDDGTIPRPSRLQRLYNDVAGYSRHRFHITCDGRDENVRAGTIQITNNPITDAPTLRPERLTLSSGKLGCYVDKSRSQFGFLRAVLLTITGGMPDDPMVSRFKCVDVTITPRRKYISATIDGEVTRFEGPMHFRCEHGALDIIGGEEE